ncbi:MAG TPA: T9SS type A sorting domain-containing protein [Ignavibacteriaceae bacterium]|nr:T9SS type A sorting domain-containing protein [Ignavibacteriaceae bacterium]
MKDSVIHSLISLKKLFLLSLITAVSFYCTAKAQAYFFSDDFESYTAGERLACQNPVDWTTWSLSPCSYEDAFVSDSIVSSGSKSFLVSYLNDEVKYWEPGDPDLWFIDFDFYIPSGKSGYFSTMASFIGTQEYGLEVYFNSDGTATLNAGGTAAATFNFQFDTWVHSSAVIYLLFDEGNFDYNGEFYYQWQWSQGANGTPIQLLVSANDFYGFSESGEMYIDNYSVTGVYWLPVDLVSFSAASNTPGKAVLNWQTATETNNKGYEIERKKCTGKYDRGTKWEKIAFIAGKGTTTEPESYSFMDNNVASGFYLYRLKQIDFNGEFNYSKEVELDLTAPAEFELCQNYPNPFNPATIIKFSIPKEVLVNLSVYDILGEKVKELKNDVMKPGYYEVELDANDLASGVYFYIINAGDPSTSSGQDFIQTKKMILLK